MGLGLCDKVCLARALPLNPSIEKVRNKFIKVLIETSAPEPYDFVEYRR